MPDFRFRGPHDKVDKHKAQSCNAANVVLIVGDPRIFVDNYQSFSDSGPSVFSVSCVHFSTFYHPFVLLHLFSSLQSTVSRSCCHLSEEEAPTSRGSKLSKLYNMCLGQVWK